MFAFIQYDASVYLVFIEYEKMVENDSMWFKILVFLLKFGIIF